MGRAQTLDVYDTHPAQCAQVLHRQAGHGLLRYGFPRPTPPPVHR
jgi:hypothetical protein